LACLESAALTNDVLSSAGVAGLPGYVSAAGTARWAKRALVVAVVADALGALADLAQIALLRPAGHRGFLTASEASDFDSLRFVGWVQLAVFVVAAVFFIGWFRRAYRNLPPLGAQGRFSTKWAVAAWLVPILNEWRPKQIANELWRTSDPDAAANQGVVRGGPLPTFFWWWWATYVGAQSLDSTAFRIGGGWSSPATITDLKTSRGIYFAADVIWVAAGVLAVLVVARTTRRQEERAARLGAAGLETGYRVLRAEPAAKTRRWAWAGGGLVLAGFVAAAAVILMTLGTAKPKPSVASAAPKPATSSSSPEGQPATPGWQTLGSDDFSDPSTGWLVQEDTSSKMGYVDGVYEIAVRRPDSIFYSLLPLQNSFGALRVEVDATLRRGSRAYDGAGVGCFLADKGYVFLVWSDGSYTIARDPGRGRDLIPLAGAGRPSVLKGFGAANRIAGECVGGGAKATRMTLYANGRWITQVSDVHGPGVFDTVGLVAESDRGPTIADFDGVAVAER